MFDQVWRGETVVVGFKVHCTWSDVYALDAAVAYAKHTASIWEAPQEAKIRTVRSRVQRAELRQELRADKRRLVRAGELAFSRDDLLRQALDRLIADQGWRLDD